MRACHGGLAREPDVNLNLPALHNPEHIAAVVPLERRPYKPAAQSVHDSAPARLNLPAVHFNVVAMMDPAAQTYPNDMCTECFIDYIYLFIF